MRILITGAAGRVGRAIYISLCAHHEVRGFDLTPSSTTDVVASIENAPLIREALRGIDAVIHTAALHAPHVGHVADAAFTAVNVSATEALAHAAHEAGVKSFVFTSTTALYGAASTPDGSAGWVDEETVPLPKSIYHHTKLMAEQLLERIAQTTALPVTVIRMSRCFPEPAPIMAAYRLHRGVDVRDVADAHALAATAPVAGFRRYVVSGSTPFLPEDCVRLWADAPAVIAERCPHLVDAFSARHWALPDQIDRVYCAHRAMTELDWRPKYGFEEVLTQLDQRSSEVLPARRQWSAAE